MNEYNTLKEFYPTPPELIAQMLKGYDMRNAESILEPSAGKGDIADFVVLAMRYVDDAGWRYNGEFKKLNSAQDRIDFTYDMLVRDIKNDEIKYNLNYCSKQKIDCIEIEPVLQNVLKGKEYTVVADDFLRFSGEKHYDLIIMNPPFSNGEEHLLKAINIAKKTGGYISCLLNADTIRNPYSNRRNFLLNTLNKYNATFEYVNNAFSEAERKTDVDVVIVKVNIPCPFGNYSRILEELEDAKFTLDEPDENITYLIRANDKYEEIKSAVLMYKKEIEVGKRLISEYLALKPYLTTTFENENTPSYMKGSILRLSNTKNDELDYNEYIYSVRYKYWYELLHKPSFMGNLPSNVRDEYFNQIKDFAKKEFSVSNICKVKIDILKNTAKALEDTIVSMFEKLSYKHSMGCENNIHYYSGWKSNDAFKINEKIVVPYIDCYDDIFKKFRYGYEMEKFLCDLERCLDFLDGGETHCGLNIDSQLNFYESVQETKNMQFKYFTVNAYKKGTIHIKFINLDVLKKLNIYGSQHKGWLPPTYGKKSYNDMTDDEKEVINSFEGEQSYNEVFSEPDRFILSANKMLLTE